MTQHGPKTTEADLAARYWITPAGLVALAQAQAAQANKTPEDQQ